MRRHSWFPVFPLTHQKCLGPLLLLLQIITTSTMTNDHSGSFFAKDASFSCL